MPRTLTKVRVHNPGTRVRNGKEKAGYRSISRFFGSSTSIKDRVGTSHPRWPKVAYKLRSSIARGKYTKSPDARSERGTNPTKRKLTLAQKLHFGTKRQRAAAKLSLSMAGKKRRVRSSNSGSTRRVAKQFEYADKTYRSNSKIPFAKAKYKMASWLKRKKVRDARIGNPGEIITLAGLAGNPGRLKTKRKVGNNMAKRRRKSVSGVRRRVRRTRRASNPKVIVRYRNHAHRKTHRRRATSVVRRRRSQRRSNPGFLSGGVGMLVGIFGGAALTGAIAARIPGQLSSGIAGYLTTGVIAYAQGTLAGKLLKNPSLGKNMVTGGLIYLGLKVAGDLIPGLSLPFGLSGLGAIASPSSFAYPQIPAPNTMIYQNAVAPPTAVATRGMGRIARMGRMF